MRIRRGVAVAAAVAAAVTTSGATGVVTGLAGDSTNRSGSGGTSVVGLTDDGRLVSFKTSSPRSARSIGAVSGLVGDTRLVGIDMRVQDGELYGVGDAGGVYVVNRSDASAMKVSQLSVALSGQEFGVDFNPAANRLRVISDTGQNLRHNIDDPNGVPSAGTTAVDGVLTYPATPAAPATVATGVTAAAYTNNDLDPMTATTLYDIDTRLDQVVIQSPANAGLVQPTGRLGMDIGAVAGFDIVSDVRGGRTVDNTAFAAVQVSGQWRLVEVRLLTGEARSLGRFGSGATVVDIAVALDD